MSKKNIKHKNFSPYRKYGGFNYFKNYDNKYLGKIVPTEAGSYDPEKFEYLQVY